jgi:soluble P-type ATPase
MEVQDHNTIFVFQVPHHVIDVLGELKAPEDLVVEVGPEQVDIMWFAALLGVVHIMVMDVVIRRWELKVVAEDNLDQMVVLAMV